MISRKAYRMPKAGSLAHLKLVQEEIPEPQDHEISIEVKAIGLNFADIFAMQGLYSATPKGSFVPGLEYSGVIHKCGKQVKDFKVGDKVMGVTRFGGYASRLNIDQRYIRPLPDSWSFEQGAAFLVQVLTAFYALKELGNIQSGQTVLIHSAAGGVGLLANRIAKRFNAYTIGTVGSTAKVDLLNKEGYDKVIVRGEDFREQLKTSLAGRELNLVLECIGGQVFKDSYEEMAPMGRLISYGSASFATHGSRPNMLKLLWKYLRRPKVDPMKMPTDNKSVMGFNLIWLYEKADIMEKLLREIDDLQLDPPLVGHQFSFEELPAAIRLFQSGRTVGKVVVSV
ncbi:synaptic vesicle VAT-1 family membrane protein [Xanthovirga aplysinae]|uniref:synaptic vesicle VAT-1 family membrane protein n=1 Tax=Xanthovirga aplysinae TaxID=2529853 RepID=UPI0012BC12AA|nr:medium chain dehydrogenase/reductase family protein [Xanthovirga aplysinae]MTI33228.1 zinc-binding dehydrogenase [Xanthovirga aplysinae]